MIHLIENFTVTTIYTLIGIRCTTFFKTCSEIDRQSQAIRYQKIQISTKSVSTITGVGTVSIFVSTEVLKQTLLIVIFGRCKITNTLRSSLDIYIVALCRSGTAKYCIIPIHIRIKHGVKSC